MGAIGVWSCSVSYTFPYNLDNKNKGHGGEQITGSEIDVNNQETANMDGLLNTSIRSKNSTDVDSMELIEQNDMKEGLINKQT